MTTTSSVELAAGRWMIDPAHSTAAFRVGTLGRAVAATVPITEGTVDIGGGGQGRPVVCARAPHHAREEHANAETGRRWYDETSSPHP